MVKDAHSCLFEASGRTEHNGVISMGYSSDKADTGSEGELCIGTDGSALKIASGEVVIPSMTGNSVLFPTKLTMAGPIRTRQSCDRCHGQKLKCPKKPGSAICARCEKAGSACVFSPAGGNPVQRQEHAYTAGPIHDELRGGLPSTEACNGLEAGMSGMDWSFLNSGLDGLDHLPIDMTDCIPPGDIASAGIVVTKEPGVAASPLTPPTEETATTTTKKSAAPDDPKSVCVTQLSKVMLDLDSIWTAIFPRSRLHIPFDDLVDKTIAELSREFSNDQLLQDFFGAAQGLIDVYPTATKLLLRLCTEDVTCTDPSCIHTLPIPAALLLLGKYVDARNLPSTIDLALGNLLLSCHLRVLDVLDRILMLAISCFKITMNSPHPQEPKYDVSVVKIGTFTPTRDASAFMQAFLMKHLVQQLRAAAQKLGVAVAAKVQDAESKETKLFSMQCEILLERHEMKAQQLHVLGEELFQCAGR
ncbi:hypothetical protein GE09DRAFT_1052357 [Coniochaeta sp. 2T2.1]|nr:hypothetical protein GE09DRAFT_1052357 [Coniochaeta sp. 2T2.1]